MKSWNKNLNTATVKAILQETGDPLTHPSFFSSSFPNALRRGVNAFKAVTDPRVGAVKAINIRGNLQGTNTLLQDFGGQFTTMPDFTNAYPDFVGTHVKALGWTSFERSVVPLSGINTL